MQKCLTFSPKSYIIIYVGTRQYLQHIKKNHRC
nr:MAG TPA: hypothetical protein [Caudoviricetes sp.]